VIASRITLPLEPFTRYPSPFTRHASIKLEEKLDMKYKVNLKKTEEGYAIWVPGLPGCWSQGKSEDDALENIKDAIEAYLAVVDRLTVDNEARYVEIANA
jgi:predicted RNase H-like HicB family nuclease